MSSDFEVEFRIGDSRWQLNFAKIQADDSIELCKLTGTKWLPLLNDFDQRDALAVKAFLWLARKKAGEQIEFDSPAMNFTWAEFRLSETSVPDAQADDGSKEQPDPTQATRSTSRKK